MPALFKNMLEARHDGFEFPAWHGISPEAKDFVSKLLVKQPADRLTISQARNHPWISQAGKRILGKPIMLKNLNEEDRKEIGDWGQVLW